MASSSASWNRPDLNTVPKAQPDIWQPTFLTQHQSIIVNDTVVHNPTNAMAVAAGLITPRDERMLNTRSDIDFLRDAMALSVRATMVTSSMARRLHTRGAEVGRLKDHILSLQRTIWQFVRTIRTLREENRVLKEMVDAYARGVTPRVMALEGLEGQIWDQLERLRRQVEAGPSNPTQDATIE